MFECLKPFEDQGLEMSKEIYREPLRSKGSVLLASIVDILDCADIDAEEEGIDEIDIDWYGTSDDENDGYI